MVEIVDAVSLMNEQSFETPEAAIESARSTAAAHYNDVIASCIGHVITSTEWCCNALRLYVDADRVLDFRCENNIVKLTVEQATPTNISRDPLEQDEILLRLGGRETLWKRGKLVVGLRNNKILAIQAMQSSYFLNVANNGVLLINVLKNCLIDKPFLFWYPAN